MLKTTTRQDKKTRQDKIKCDSFLSYLVVVLSMRVFRSFMEKYSMASWIMIHAAMLHFSAKGRSTRMPKTTTRQETKYKKGRSMNKVKGVNEYVCRNATYSHLMKGKTRQDMAVVCKGNIRQHMRWKGLGKDLSYIFPLLLCPCHIS